MKLKLFVLTHIVNLYNIAERVKIAFLGTKTHDFKRLRLNRLVRPQLKTDINLPKLNLLLPNYHWTGFENITFTATDPSGFPGVFTFEY